MLVAKRKQARRLLAAQARRARSGIMKAKAREPEVAQPRPEEEWWQPVARRTALAIWPSQLQWRPESVSVWVVVANFAPPSSGSGPELGKVSAWLSGSSCCLL